MVAMLDELLNDIIAEDANVQRRYIWHEFGEHAFFVFAICFFNLRLDETRSMLIPAEFSYVAVNLLPL